MTPVRLSFAALALATLLAGCGGGPRQSMQRDDEWHPPVEILRHYVDKDGRLTRAELEAGLRRDFEAADLNHDGVLEPDEVRAVNQKRWEEDKSATSPLIDWKGNGLIDFNEFAATPRALFNQLDRNGDGVLTPDELRPPRAPAPGSENQIPSGDEDRPRRGPRE